MLMKMSQFVIIRVVPRIQARPCSLYRSGLFLLKTYPVYTLVKDPIIYNLDIKFGCTIWMYALDIQIRYKNNTH